MPETKIRLLSYPAEFHLQNDHTQKNERLERIAYTYIQNQTSVAVRIE